MPYRNVGSDMPAVSVLPRLLDSPDQRLGVKDGEELLGVIDRDSMLEGIGRMIAARDDCSVITVECAPGDYSITYRVSRTPLRIQMRILSIYGAFPLTAGR